MQSRPQMRVKGVELTDSMMCDGDRPHTGGTQEEDCP